MSKAASTRFTPGLADRSNPPQDPVTSPAQDARPDHGVPRIRSALSPAQSPAPALSDAEARALVGSLAPLLHEWLPRQRWFAGKGRPVTGFVPVAVTELLPQSAGGPGLFHLLVRVEQRGAASPAPASSRYQDCYQLLLGVRHSLPAPLAAAAIGRVEQGPLAGRTVYEGLHDPRVADLLLERLRTPDTRGPLRFCRAAPLPAGLTGRLLDAEQSNSSLVYGSGGSDAYILKILRRVFPGPHPDLELPLALAAEGCERVPAPVGWIEAADPSGGGLPGSGETLTLGVLQPYLRDSRDGWCLALAALTGDREFTAEARALGRATAEVHTALAAALPTVTLGRRQTAQLADGMTERLEAAARAVPALLPYVPGLRTAFDALAAPAGAGRGRLAQRVHGDLHLGQALRTPDGRWSVIDFEGEPARPLAERRRPQPPVRDVAGMLRSFDYAARSHEPWRPDWATRCRAAYCEGYAAAAGTDPRAEPELLRAYETDKAVYEVLYEARHRPDWLPVPMAAIRRLAAGT
ncbi:MULTISPECIES: maltokinase N-terminal cap-like domain-containing protein [unclassified Streptomyces]|uniref:maltokinase N-terminal cap-like domain-containing protein n=1 Tax=unclassified Streptomyces TaxID=2593676 RepID=UPI002E762887|nr:phosphotransferase [Streptomyces sp. JV176]MEE1804756.1 phosphotransferase [Streptomyces sp. JV176]